MEPIRLLDMGDVPAVRSQTVYHGIAHAMQPDTLDTIILVSPEKPYISIGYHQELEKEVDLAYCEKHDLPIVRREVGGGAVYLDNNQVFIQWIFHAENLPASLDERFALYTKPLVETYRALGIEAYHRPINDIHVKGKKIGGIGAAQIGISEVIVGSLMFDFDKTIMAQVLKVSSEKMRDKIISSLEQYMTTIKEQLGELPDRNLVKRLYLEKCTALLRRKIIVGNWNPVEEALISEKDHLLASPNWLYKKGGLRKHGVKIHQDVQVVESSLKAQGGLIRATVCIRNGCMEDVILSGDFTIFPTSSLEIMENSLKGVKRNRDILLPRIHNIYQELDIQSPGVIPEDFVEVILLTNEGI